MFTLSVARASSASPVLRCLKNLQKCVLGAAGAAWLLAGCGGSSTPTTPTTPTAVAPTFSPASGTFTSAQSVTLTDSTPGAVIHYTLDGSVPTSASATYSTAIAVSSPTTISAIAVATGYNNSAAASATYTIAATAPTFTPAAGVYTAPQTISIADSTTGATIYYTLDGSTPTASSTKYTAPFVVPATATVNAVAIVSGLANSAVATAAYTINLPPAAAPTFSPAPGTFSAPQTVAISDATAGATIYYTLDGSAPTTASLRYTAPLTVNTTTTINAIAAGASGYVASAVSTGVFTINLPPAATPTFSPVAGTYTSVQTVSIADATAGAIIYYTTDGTTPTTASARYTAALTISSTTTIKAIATATNYTTSAVGSGTFTINLPPAATPTFSPAPGTYTSAQTVTISDSSAGATIYYTLDGTTPTTASARYTGAINVNSTETISAIATASGFTTSAVGSGTFTINLPPAATPTFSTPAGTFTSAQTISISDATTGAVIYYTLDGSTPTTSSARYVAPISVASTETLNAIATATGYATSAVASATYTINLPPAATPTFSPAAGTYTTYQTVTISDSTSGATIYYTLDGSTPTTASAKYATAISVTSSETINAIATASGSAQSAVGSAKYIINLQPAPSVTFTPAAGTYTSIQTVTLADSATGATIYYTIDGSTPTTASMVYGGPLTVGTTETINAIATASGYTQSSVASAMYTINLPAAATPTFTPRAGSYTSAQTVTIADATAGATIYYTTDGSTPTTASAVYSTPLTVSSTETINAIATATGYTQSAVGSALYTITSTSPTVAVTLSTYNSSAQLTAQTPVQFGTNALGTNLVQIDETKTYQTVEGFGASFTDASAINLEQMETPSTLPGTLSDLFTRTGNGIGLSFMRNPIGASDMAKTIYTFDDVPSGSTDPTLASFSIAHDLTNIIPLIKSAKALNPSMKVMASPWSPPAWMKVGQTINGGTLQTSAYGYLSNYLVKYLQAYQAQGLLPDYLSVQNEPLNQVPGYPTMYMDEPTQLTVIRDNLLPALSASGLSTKVLLYDHNWDTPSYPASLLADETLLASPVIAGTAWHGYGGPAGAQLGVANQYPTKGQWETEHSGGTFVGSQSAQFISDFNEITLVMRSAGKSYIKWNLALDQNNGPNTSQLGSNYSGCNTCSPIIQVNTNTGVATKTIEYYSLGQFSKFVLPGAIRVWSSDAPTIVSSAYINPDGTRVLVAFNNSFSSSTFQVQWGAQQNFSYTLGAYAGATFVWSGTQAGTPTQSATQQIQGVNFVTATGLEVEETTDTTGSYDLGYVVDGATVHYTNVNFGTGVNFVNVRAASGGNGGTVEFHLDSPTGTLLGTATLANTGGYQSWQTVSQPLGTTTSGLHDLYMVIHGSGGIGNVNWFQFCTNAACQ